MTQDQTNEKEEMTQEERSLGLRQLLRELFGDRYVTRFDRIDYEALAHVIKMSPGTMRMALSQGRLSRNIAYKLLEELEQTRGEPVSTAIFADYLTD